MTSQRQQFEVWATKRGMPLTEHSNRYWSHDTHIAWQYGKPPNSTASQIKA